MRVTIAQLEVSADHSANVVVVRQACAEAALVSADLLVLPEYASGYDPRGVGIEHAESLAGPFVQLLREQSAETGVTIVAGMVTFPEGAAHGADPGPDRAAAAPRASNIVVVVRGGEVVGAYRKVHLYDAFGHRESDRLEPGDPAAPPLVVTVGDLAVGIMTCYDLRFPESARRLVDAGAQVLVVPAAWAAGPGKVDQWRVLARARAIENTCAVLAVGQAGKGVSGHSLLVGPDGSVAIELADAAAVTSADIDAAGIAAERDRNPSLANRRYTVVPVPTAPTAPLTPTD
ncbi:Predicted amidohydrolase [Sanguibacter gelidistatuariae]|uniref:Predicted amidohydrolase n=1 Tax=Sanguibacter gelidistatuariae TaxID=1814289 RepID=A0A1G6QIM2_9MICO|nr:nitrilase-related carbon-nitrogen hydrolase [Sanguibacter gelidistatuariae]SDC92173.1 Predicted amidohydrolase [Sanguibacter gelidistatuariae]